MEKSLIFSLYIFSFLLLIPCIILGRMANLHNPAEGVDHRLAWWALVFGILSNLGGITFMIYVFYNAINYKG